MAHPAWRCWLQVCRRPRCPLERPSGALTPGNLAERATSWPGHTGVCLLCPWGSFGTLGISLASGCQAGLTRWHRPLLTGGWGTLHVGKRCQQGLSASTSGVTRSHAVGTGGARQAWGLRRAPHPTHALLPPCFLPQGTSPTPGAGRVGMGSQLQGGGDSRPAQALRCGEGFSSEQQI